MKFTATLFSAVLIATVTSRPVKRNVNPALVPEFGLAAGVNPTGTGDCDGAVNGADGKPIKVPCACPPDRAAFIADLNANVQAGHAVNNPSVSLSFPEDNSQASQEARLNAATVTLQNLNGPGKGCPSAATTFGAQLKAIQSGAAPPAAAPAPPAPAPASAPAPAPAAAAPAAAPAAGGASSLSTQQLDALVPGFGITAGTNPTGTGDCDGTTGADGKAIKIPCACPPARQDFLQQLQVNVKAGDAVNNPSVKVSFPTDNSKASQSARITAALITLQNLNGPGKGCPASSTTLLAQQKALGN